LIAMPAITRSQALKMMNADGKELVSVLMNAQTMGSDPIAWKIVFQTMLRCQDLVHQVFAGYPETSVSLRDLCKKFYCESRFGGMQDVCRRCRNVFWPQVAPVPDPIAAAREQVRAEVAERAAARAAAIIAGDAAI